MGKTKQLTAIAMISMAITGCSDSNTGSEKGSTNNPPVGEQSFWSAADFSLQKSATLSFAGSVDMLMSDSIAELEDRAAHIQTEQYDQYNRMTSTEILVLSQEGAEPRRGLLLEHFYNADNYSESTTMQIYDAWWSGASGELQESYVWSDLAFEHDVPTASQEFVTYYDVTSGDSTQEIETYSTLEYNDQHLLVQRTFDDDENAANGTIGHETWERDAEGKLLRVVNQDNQIVASYDYYDNGSLRTVTRYSAEESITETGYYEYAVVEGVHAIIIDLHFYPGADNERYETKVMLMEEKACHTSTVNRIRFNRPQDANCFARGDWQ